MANLPNFIPPITFCSEFAKFFHCQVSLHTVVIVSYMTETTCTYILATIYMFCFIYSSKFYSDSSQFLSEFCAMYVSTTYAVEVQFDDSTGFMTMSSYYPWYNVFRQWWLPVYTGYLSILTTLCMQSTLLYVTNLVI